MNSCVVAVFGTGHHVNSHVVVVSGTGHHMNSYVVVVSGTGHHMNSHVVVVSGTGHHMNSCCGRVWHRTSHELKTDPALLACTESSLLSAGFRR